EIHGDYADPVGIVPAQIGFHQMRSDKIGGFAARAECAEQLGHCCAQHFSIDLHDPPLAPEWLEVYASALPSVSHIGFVSRNATPKYARPDAPFRGASGRKFSAWL